ncbi:MAG: hypothetical protein Sv326_0694 [Candidatus Fermentimicrarchaeum limneticum]|uniref:Uncharacterized protein n=1 Tax=Fermentimicrarchaeum limneticum TaxID=2795018 RepID=A0A7D5XJR6_FERL1|nr:MAG: hypothetical protein Sv326_0694 [Candidatus Fermentimicrarchaeum limneticum]
MTRVIDTTDDAAIADPTSPVWVRELKEMVMTGQIRSHEMRKKILEL